MTKDSVKELIRLFHELFDDNKIDSLDTLHKEECNDNDANVAQDK